MVPVEATSWPLPVFITFSKLLLDFCESWTITTYEILPSRLQLTFLLVLLKVNVIFGLEILYVSFI